MNKPTFKELEEASKPLIELLNKYYDPMTILTIENGNVKIYCQDMGLPLFIGD